MYKRRRIASTSLKGESKWLAPLLGSAASIGATYFGAPQLAPAAYSIGSAIGHKIKQVTGYGDYTIRRNTLAGSVPQVSNPASGIGMTISHREYIGDIVTGPANSFSLSSIVINPSNQLFSEWLAGIACNFEEWKPEGILFYFKSTSADALNSVNTALGTVVMATQYNPYSTPFNSKADMESYEYSCSGVPSQDIVHMIECDPWQGAISTYFTGSGANTPGDLRFNQLGTFYIATTGFQGANVNIGELWVTYQFTLLKPKLWSTLANQIDYGSWSNTVDYNSTQGPMGLFYNSYTQSDRTNIPFTGVTASGAMHATNPSNYVTRLHMPMYSHPTRYLVTIYTVYANSPSPNFTIAASNASYPSYTLPTIGVYSLAPGVGVPLVNQASHIEFLCYFPGGALYNSATPSTPWVSIEFTGASGLVHTQVYVVQIPVYP